MNTEQEYLCKFNLGQHVITKKTGLPTSGLIIAIEYAITFYNRVSERYFINKKHPWDDIYPEWRNTKKLVYTLMFKEPQYIVSYKEFLEQAPVEWHTREYYEEKVRKDLYAIYPEDDLELFE
jgi:hypothetical protein